MLQVILWIRKRSKTQMDRN